MPRWNCLPVFLIATAALLMDHSLILPRDRIYIQMLLWLAASLQPAPGISTAPVSTNNSHDDDHDHYDWMICCMVNVIFLANLLQHASWFQPFQRRYHYHQKYLKDYLRIVGPSAWITLLYLCLAWPCPSSSVTSLTEQDKTQETIYMQRGWWVFGMSWLVLAMYTWQTIRTNMIMRSRQSDAIMTGMPISVGHDRRNHLLYHPPLDLRTWYEWSPSQVGAWIVSLAAHGGGGGGDEADSGRSHVVAEDSDQGSNKRPQQHDWQQVVDLLAPEQMAGAELTTLTVQDLRCIMGIPYGTASRLVREIQRLVAKYPAPSSLQLHYNNRVQEPTTRASDDYDDEKKEHASETSWLPRYFEDYYDDYRPHDKERNDLSGGKEYGDDCTDERISEQQHQQAREIMQKRFGMEMPIMTSTSRKTRPENHDDRTTQPFHRHEPFQPATQVQQPLQEQVPSILKELPPQLLESMPRHIQEICHRNPELLRQVLAMKQQPQPTPISTPPFPNSDDNLLFPQHHEVSDTKPPATTLPEQPRAHVQHDYLSQPPPVVHQMYDDDDEDGERTELLRKRRVDFNLYRATS